MEPLQLLQAVREVSLLADQDQPTGITQRAFDDARVQSEKFPNLPRAKRIVDRLNAKRRAKRLTWQQILERAHSPDETGEQSVRSGEAAPDQDWLTDEQIGFALKLVTHRLSTETVSKDQYISELGKMRSEGVDVDQLHLPTERQIMRVARHKLRTKERAFTLRIRIRPKTNAAHLATRGSIPAKGAPKAPRSAPKTASAAAKPVSATPKSARKGSKPAQVAAKPASLKSKPAPAVPPESAWNFALELARLEPYQPQRTKVVVGPIELIERCYAAHGAVPTRDEAIIFARANDISQERKQDLTWSAAVAQWKKEREAKGLPCPAGPPPRHERPDYAKPVGAGKPEERRPRSWTSIDECLSHVTAYLKQLSAGERSTRDGYERWAKEQNAVSRSGSGPAVAGPAAGGPAADDPAAGGSVAAAAIAGAPVVPNSSAFAKHGGWTRVRKLAQERMLPGYQKVSEGVDEITPPRARKPVWKPGETIPGTNTPVALLAALAKPRPSRQKRSKQPQTSQTRRTPTLTSHRARDFRSSKPKTADPARLWRARTLDGGKRVPTSRKTGANPHQYAIENCPIKCLQIGSFWDWSGGVFRVVGVLSIPCPLRETPANTGLFQLLATLPSE